MAITIGPRDSSVGDVRHSILTEAQFQSINGTGWVLMDGRDITGSALATVTGNNTLPDARGLTLRAKNNGRSDGNEDPDGERAIGDYQGDAIRNMTGSSTGYTSEGGAPGLQGVMDTTFVGGGRAAGGGGGIISWTFDASRQVPTAADNRMKNIAVNIFIKIN